MPFVEVASTADVPEGEARKVTPKGVEVALVNLGGGEYRAVGDICSHAHYFLSEGEVDVEDRTIECPKHGSTFDLDTGAPKTLPATTPVPAFPVKVDGDTILIDMED
ncbi:MAG TPA: non-heme iron oxygenase ferredoxin subunit [Actinomycetota bacterium]|nr:non-heme iron oxygenase ferredoxin subunit [Actinomycetota bacterium]